MTPSIKSSLIIIITLLIGIAIGFEISEISEKKYMEQMRRPREREGFIQMFDRVIKPDAKQKPIIDTILIRYHRRIEKVAEDNMTKIKAIIDSMHAELKTKLNDEQKKQLDNEMARMRKNAPHPGPRNGFPPPPERQGPPPDKQGGPPPDGFGPPQEKKF
jgi:uncharacterized membrane-anchored protein YhcB (DUF1043 family)